MDDKTFLSGRLEKVYFFMGSLPNDASRRRFIKAPFDLYNLDGEMYLVPTSSYANGRPSDLAGILGQDEGHDLDLGQQFAFDSLENVVLERHMMGDYKSSKENWMQAHLFGPV